jgi:hypothetical protein
VTRLPQQVLALQRSSLDFSQAKPNPYAKRLKKEIRLQLDKQTVGYFETLSEETGIPSRTLIKLYLRECAARLLMLPTVDRATAPVV